MWRERERAIVEIGHGSYGKATVVADDDLADIALKSGSATICLASALARHNLSDENLAALDIAWPGSRPGPSGCRLRCGIVRARKGRVPVWAQHDVVDRGLGVHVAPWPKVEQHPRADHTVDDGGEAPARAPVGRSGDDVHHRVVLIVSGGQVRRNRPRHDRPPEVVGVEMDPPVDSGGDPPRDRRLSLHRVARSG